jgi:hypothetical protein
MWMRVLVGKKKFRQSRSRYATATGCTHPNEIPAAERFWFAGHELLLLFVVTLSMLIHSAREQHNNKSRV